jgi:hypothetical protein
VNNLEQRVGITEYQKTSKISKMLPWNALVIPFFLAPIWISALIFSIISVW